MKILLIGLLAIASASAFADQSGSYICRKIDIFDGGTRGGTWKVTVSKNLKTASFVYSYYFNLDYKKIVFPSSPVFTLKRVGTNWGHLRFQDVITSDDLSSIFSFNLMGTESPQDGLQSKDAVLTQIQDGEKSASLCVKI